MNKKIVFTYLNVKWKFEFSEHTFDLIMPFYKDYFIESDETDNFDFKVVLVENKFDDLSKILIRGSDILIHNSEKPLFHDTGKKLDVGNIRYVFNYITKSVYEINYIYNEVTIYNTDIEMLARDGIRVSRDFVKIFVDNTYRFSMFHCSAVLNEHNECIVFMGEKSKGKTTISLDLIYNYGYHELARDRLYLGLKNETIYVYGWPTYYNLTMKTLKYFDETKSLFPLKYAKLDDGVISNLKTKVQLLPDEIGVHNRVKEAAATYFIILSREGEDSNLKRIIAKNCFSPYDTYTTEWHGLDHNKKNILDNARNICSKLIESNRILTLIVNDDINETIKSLHDLIKNTKTGI